MTITDEEIMAYVDNEMDEEARNRVTLAALSDMAIAQKIADQRALRDTLATHFAPVMAQPLPPQWAEAIRRETTGAQVVDLAQVRAQRKAAAPRWYRSAWAGGAIAASLALGVFTGIQWQASRSIIRADGGALLARGTLAYALDTQSAGKPGQKMQMLGTFRREGGDLCRVFAGPKASGIACHAGNQWRLEHVLPGTKPQTGDYRQAGSQQAQLMTLAQDMAKGDPLDAKQEAEAQAKGWR